MSVPEDALGIFSGLLEDIPANWLLCDGDGGTPNLIAKFLRGAPAGQEPGSTGGADSHTHTDGSAGAHTHTLSAHHHNHGTVPSGNHDHGTTTYNAGSSTKPDISQGSHWHAVNLSADHIHTAASAGAHTHTISSDDGRPPYYEVAFIQAQAGAEVFTGLIIVWTGLLASIPAGWALCEGTPPRPDLRTRFLRGVNTSSTDPGGTGGASTHGHTKGNSAAHAHTMDSLGTHSHSFNAFTLSHDHVSGTGDGTTSSGTRAVMTSSPPNDFAHTHNDTSSTGGHNHNPMGNGGIHAHTVNMASSLPSYYDVVFIYAASATKIPSGGILGWAGLLADIPANYTLCNGSSPAPDLRGRFLRGSAAGVDPGGTGGSDGHSHTDVTAGAHNDHSQTSSGNHQHSATNSAGSHTHSTVNRSYSTPVSTRLINNSGGAHTHTFNYEGAHTHTSIDSQGDHAHTWDGGGTIDGRPVYYEVAWIYQTTVDDSENLRCGFEVRHPSSASLSSKFSVRRSSSGDLKGGFEGQAVGSLRFGFAIRHGSSEDLKSGFDSQATRQLSASIWVSPANYLGGWNYRKGLMVRASTSGAQANYPVWVRLHYGSGVDGDREVYLEGKAQLGFEDVRVTSKDGVTVVPHWIDPDSVVPGVSALLWIKHDSISAPGAPVYIYFGCRKVADASDIEGTFDKFADDFEDNTIDPAKWTMATHGSGGSYTEQTEELALQSSDNQTGSATARTNTSFTKGLSIEFRARASQENYYGFVLGKGDYIGESCGGADWWHTFLEQGYIACVQDNSNFQYRFAHCPGGVDVSEAGIDGPDSGSYHYFRIIYKANGDFRWYWSPDGMTWVLLGSGYNEITYLNDAKYLMFYRGGWSGAARGGWLGISWVGVRTYVDSEPYPNECSELQENPVQSEPLPSGFSVRRSSTGSLKAGFNIVHHIDLGAALTIRNTVSASLEAGFLTRHPGSENLNAGFSGQEVRRLSSEFVVRHGAIRDLKAGFEGQAILSLSSRFVIRHGASRDLGAGFEGQATRQLPSELVARHGAVTALKAGLIPRRTSTVDLGAGFLARHRSLSIVKAGLLIRHPSLGFLKALLRMRRTASRSLSASLRTRRRASTELSSELLARHRAAVWLSAGFLLGRSGEADLISGFSVRKRRYNRLRGRFEARHATFTILPAGFLMRVPRSIGLSAQLFVINKDDEDLASGFEIIRFSSRDLKAGFNGQASRRISSCFEIRRSLIREIRSQLIVRDRASRRLKAGFEGQATFDLNSSFTIRHSSYDVLPSSFGIRHSASTSLGAGLLPRRSASIDGPSAAFVARQRGEGNLLSGLEIRHSAYVDFPGSFGVAHWVRLGSAFAVRQPWPYWTDRRYVNGVVVLEEVMLGDAVFEEIIAGVMNDIRTWLIAHSRLEYDLWFDITRTPRAIVRATTYGVVASLYARRIYAPLKKDIITIPPVSVKVLSSEEDAMEYWEGRMEAALENYLRAVGMKPLWISTEDEDAKFTMEDIPLWKEIE